jgi:hypothetical protein
MCKKCNHSSEHHKNGGGQLYTFFLYNIKIFFRYNVYDNEEAGHVVPEHAADVRRLRRAQSPRTPGEEHRTPRHPCANPRSIYHNINY